jgi:hypothetical protein
MLVMRRFAHVEGDADVYGGNVLRHLIHYELDPSPVRTIQRYGRVRRVVSWASRHGCCVVRPIIMAVAAIAEQPPLAHSWPTTLYRLINTGDA